MQPTEEDLRVYEKIIDDLAAGLQMDVVSHVSERSNHLGIDLAVDAGFQLFLRTMIILRESAPVRYEEAVTRAAAKMGVEREALHQRVMSAEAARRLGAEVGKL